MQGSRKTCQNHAQEMYSIVSNIHTFVLLNQKEHSIHMLSIQIDAKSLELIIYHQFNNIKLSFFAIRMKLSFPQYDVHKF